MNDNPQNKIKPFERTMKKLCKEARLNTGLSMSGAAAMLGVTRKQLEDFETVRNYGCHVGLEWILKVATAYNIRFQIKRDSIAILPETGSRVRESLELISPI